MIKTVLRATAAVVAGIVVAFLLVIAVELFGSIVHPFPAEFTGTSDEMCRHVERFPVWVLAAVVPMWGCTAFAGSWIAQRVGTIASAAIVGVLLTGAAASNVAMLPYPGWFKAANLIVIPAASALGSRLARRRAAPARVRP
jgi:hypothetical protein